ncbi:hypothetical protein GQ464_007915 [Rhodocaloribacter litoris]|uniref:Asp23/Gls24 family envelope stress response protein n=1 Tax=Rhodocaloribacter litoris TaxID=2558931 RepID=UPI001422E07F|nr:Asp23/Gls24 family envelope stress response protein [Rhodocaloribacter litoris]QXD16853.1 hypothetical protein GQ464_007915 [Rhodocaloribacter litoris]GIV60490.1 MAG: hypothetical protein KatS3mg043_1579 [Rhodothermaceae bacterium]
MNHENALELLRRLLVALLGGLWLAAGVLVFLHAMEMTGPVVWVRGGFTLVLNLAEQPFGTVLTWAALAVWAILAGLLLLALALMRVADEGRRIVLRGTAPNGFYGGGQLTVAQRSLEALAAYTAERVDGVREARPRLRLRRKGWHIACRVTLAPDAALPDVSTRLKTALHDAIEHHTGLPVARVDIDAQLHAIDAHRRVR